MLLRVVRDVTKNKIIKIKIHSKRSPPLEFAKVSTVGFFVYRWQHVTKLHLVSACQFWLSYINDVPCKRNVNNEATFVLKMSSIIVKISNDHFEKKHPCRLCKNDLKKKKAHPRVLKRKEGHAGFLFKILRRGNSLKSGDGTLSVHACVFWQGRKRDLLLWKYKWECVYVCWKGKVHNIYTHHM